MTFDPAPLVDAACEVLRRLGPLEAATLATHLDPAVFGDEWHAHEYAEVVDGCLMDSDRVIELPDGRLADGPRRTFGLATPRKWVLRSSTESAPAE